ncbi:MAG: VOC family protein [Actinomycetota bacterium]
MARVLPMLAYADAAAAIEFLSRAFGFKETMRMDGENESIGHAELSLDGAVISLATVWRDGGFSTPHELGGVHGQLWVEVDDIDAHYRRAKAEGATVLSEPSQQDYGYCTYRAIDPEGHRWYFASLSDS